MSLVRFPLRPVTLAAALALQTLSVSAQTAPDTADDAGRLPTVTVRAASADASAEGLTAPYAGGQVARGSRIGVLGNQDMMDTPFSVTSYTSRLIQDQQAQSIGDVLLNDASVRSARGFGNFQQAYYIRGFTVFSDDVAYNGLYGLVPRQYMATEFVERVEVFRGANAFLSGSGAGSVGGSGIGGLINVVPKRAPNDPLSQVTFGVQSGGQTQVATDIARRFGPDSSTGVRVNVGKRVGDLAVDDEYQNLGLGAVGLDWHNRHVRLSGDVGYQTNKLRRARPSVTPTTASGIPDAPDAEDNFAYPWTYSNSRDAFATLRGEVDLNNSVTAWAAYGMRRSKEDNSLAGPTLEDDLGNFTASRFDNIRKDKVRTGEIGIRGKLETGSVKHALTATATRFKSTERNAYAYSTSISGNYLSPIDVARPAAPFTPAGGLLTAPPIRERIETSSIAVADTLSFAQDTVLLTVGARRQTIKDTGYSYDFSTGAQSISVYDETKTTPVAGLVVKLNKNLSVYGNYIEGLVKGDIAAAPFATTIANEGQVFAPYISRQKEVGVKYDGGNIGGSVAYFTTNKPLAFVENGVFGVFGQQRNQGWEFSAFGQPLKGLRMIAGLTLLDAEQRDTQNGINDGNEAIGVAKHQLNVGADWDVPGVRGLTVNGLVLHTGKQYADAANTLRLPSWTRLDVGTRYLVDLGSDRVLTLRGRIENVLNKDYWESAGGYPGAGYLVLAQPRTISLSASVDF